LERVQGCSVVLSLGFSVCVIVAVASFSSSVMSSQAVLTVVATCTEVSGRVGFTKESLSSVLFVVVIGVIVLLVVIVVIVISSMLQCGRFRVFIVWMLAARAARSIRNGGGAREMKVLWVLAAVVVFDDSRSIVCGSWSMKRQPLRFAAAVSTVL